MFFSQKRKFNYEFYTNKLKIFYSRVLKDVFIVKNVLIGAFYVVLNDVLVHFFTKFWKFKKNAFFRYVKRLGMTTVGMPGPVNSIYLPGTITFSHLAVKK